MTKDGRDGTTVRGCIIAVRVLSSLVMYWWLRARYLSIDGHNKTHHNTTKQEKRLLYHQPY